MIYIAITGVESFAIYEDKNKIPACVPFFEAESVPTKPDDGKEYRLDADVYSQTLKWVEVETHTVEQEPEDPEDDIWNELDAAYQEGVDSI